MLGMCLDFCTVQKDKATIEKHKVSFGLESVRRVLGSFCGHLRPSCSVSPEFSVGPVPEVGPHEQNKAAAARPGEKRLPATPRVPLGVQGAAAPHPAEDHAPQSRERHAESENNNKKQTLCGLLTILTIKSLSSSPSRVLPAVCCHSGPQPVRHGHWEGSGR